MLVWQTPGEDRSILALLASSDNLRRVLAYFCVGHFAPQRFDSEGQLSR